MSRDHMSGVSDYDAVSNWTGGTPSEANSIDTIKDLMQRFTLDCQPDLTLKLRSRWAGTGPGGGPWRCRRSPGAQARPAWGPSAGCGLGMTMHASDSGMCAAPTASQHAPQGFGHHPGGGHHPQPRDKHAEEGAGGAWRHVPRSARAHDPVCAAGRPSALWLPCGHAHLIPLLSPPSFGPQVKPVSLQAPWRRLRVDDTGTVQLRSKKLQWWLLTLDMEGHVNPRTRTSSLNWR